MSRVGKMPIKIPSNVEVNIGREKVTVNGPKGKLDFSLPNGIFLTRKDDELLVKCKDDAQIKSSLYGLIRALLANVVKGVTEGFKKEIELEGVGYRAQVEGDNLNLTLGFSHPVKVKAPAGISFSLSENKIAVLGIDKQLVGKVASQIRSLKPPEPYKGKGIRYVGERIRRKAGKAAKTIGVGK